MQTAHVSALVAAVVLGSGGYALTRTPADLPVPTALAASNGPSTSLETGSPEGDEDPGPNLQPDDEAPTLAWTAPSAWTEAPNPNAMRLATYRVPHAAADADDAELSVARAGGDVDANVERWAAQFSGKIRPRRFERVVNGVSVTVVAMEGSYEGGPQGSDSTPHVGWALLGAIVNAPGLPYFFKLTGPAATVRAARPAFEKMIDGVRPATP